MKRKHYGRRSQWITWAFTFALTFLLSIGSSYAFFTATAGAKVASVTTAIIRVGFTSATDTTIYAEENVTISRALPGSTITFHGAVENTGNSKIWALVELKIEIADTETPVLHKYYTATGAEIQGTPGNYTTSATAIDQSETSPFTISYTFSTDLDNTYKGKAIQLTAVARAIQHKNISTGVVATNSLLPTT